MITGGGGGGVSESGNTGNGSVGGAGLSLAAGSTLTNDADASITGGSGGGSYLGNAGSGGSGVDIANSSLTNHGTITGGVGGSAGEYNGGSGGSGVNVTGSSLTNSGSIAGGNGGDSGTEAGLGPDGGAGVYLGAASSLTNTGWITGGTAGPASNMEDVHGFGGSGVVATNSSLTNDATIIGGYGGYGGYGVDATSSTVTNNGVIADGGFLGGFGLFALTAVDLTGSTLINNGEIVGTFAGVSLSSGGLVTNAGTAGITGSSYGVFVNGTGTVVNAGTIAAGDGGPVDPDAVYFSGAGTDLLVVDPGAVFVGNVVAQGFPATLELASAAGAGTIAGIGSSFSGFGTITVDADATWVVTGPVVASDAIDLSATSTLTLDGGVTAASPVHFTADTGILRLSNPVGFAATVYGVQPGVAFDFTSITSAGSITAGVNGSNELTLTSGGTLLTEIQLDPSQSFAGKSFHAAPDGSGGTLVTETETPICFLRGTLITTPSGEVPIEQLAVSDLVLTARGEARPVAWIGTGRVVATRGRRNTSTPVIVRKGALADNVPHHDLRVTKAHSLYLDGVLIPVEFLVNHRTIQWDDLAQDVALYHVELAAHDVLLANGVAAESYRDDGNRWLFRNANSGGNLPPRPPCARVLTDGPVVDAAWQRLLQRTGARVGLPMTDDPDLHLLVDGRRLDTASQRGAWHVFHLASRPRRLRIVSRASAPQELGLARDPRSLGVAVRLIMVRRGAQVRSLAADDPLLTDGFHAFEADDDIRWTDGDAGVPADLLRGFSFPCEIVLRLGGATRYVDEGTAVRRVA